MTMDIDLEQVFAILDENQEGQIQLRRFVDVANNYYSDAEVSTPERAAALFAGQLTVRQSISKLFSCSSEWRSKRKENNRMRVAKNTDSPGVKCVAGRRYVRVKGQSMLTRSVLATRSHYQRLGPRQYRPDQLRSILRRHRSNQFVARLDIERSRVRLDTAQPRELPGRRFRSSKFGKPSPSPFPITRARKEGSRAAIDVHVPVL